MKKLTGVTLIEIIITITLLGIISGVGGPLIYHAVKARSQAIAMENLYDNGQYALMFICRDLQSIKGNNATDLSNLGSNTITFIDSQGNTIVYGYIGSPSFMITRTFNGTAQYLAVNISAISFQYLDASGATTSTAANVRFIKVSITTQDDDFSHVFTRTVYLRNST